MQCTIKCNSLLKPLQQVNSLISGRLTSSVLYNLLISVNQNFLTLTGIDLDTEITFNIKLNSHNKTGTTIIQLRKLLDICRSLPKNADINLILKDKRLLINSGYSNFWILVDEKNKFPEITKLSNAIEFTLFKTAVKYLISKTQNFVAIQDSRHYLNGLLFENNERKIYAVATDGYRLAVCYILSETSTKKFSVIIPRKSIIGLSRILDDNLDQLKIQISLNSIIISSNNFILKTKLISGNFPDYRQIVLHRYEKLVIINCSLFKEVLNRVSALSNSKFYCVCLSFTKNNLEIFTRNTENEEAEEQISIIYNYENLEINFNIYYLLDALNIFDCKTIQLKFTDSISCFQMEDPNNESFFCVIMPIRK